MQLQCQHVNGHVLVGREDYLASAQMYVFAEVDSTCRQGDRGNYSCLGVALPTL